MRTMSLQEITYLFKESRVKKDLFLIAFCIPLLLLLLFLLPSSIKNELILNYENLRALNLFTTHFMHGGMIHLGSNVMWYLYLVIPIYLLNMLRHQRKGFYLMFALTILVGPLFLSIVNLIVKYVCALQISTSLGFSGIVCIFLGYLPYFILYSLKKLYKWKTRISMLFLSLLFISFLLITLVYYTLIIVIMCLGFSLICFYISYRDGSLRELCTSLRTASRTHKGIFVLIAMSIVLYFTGLLSIFPKELIVGGSVVDIMSHYFGFVFGIFISLFVDKTESKG